MRMLRYFVVAFVILLTSLPMARLGLRSIFPPWPEGEDTAGLEVGCDKPPRVSNPQYRPGNWNLNLQYTIQWTSVCVCVFIYMCVEKLLTSLPLSWKMGQTIPVEQGREVAGLFAKEQGMLGISGLESGDGPSEHWTFLTWTPLPQDTEHFNNNGIYFRTNGIFDVLYRFEMYSWNGGF